MLLVRHNKLRAPYHDYSRLDLNQLQGLASGKISPDIATLPDELPLPVEHLHRAERFICSTSKRTRQTCLALCDRLRLTQPLHIDGALNEIFFDPAKMLDHPDENPLEAVRKKLYSAIIRNDGSAEPPAELEKRINKIMRAYAGQPVVLFSHGFLIRLIDAYLHTQGHMAQALELAATLPGIDYLGTLSCESAHDDAPDRNKTVMI